VFVRWHSTFQRWIPIHWREDIRQRTTDRQEIQLWVWWALSAI